MIPANVYIKAVSNYGSTAVSSFPIKFEVCPDQPVPISSSTIFFTNLTEADPIVVKDMTSFFSVNYEFPAACTGTSYDISYDATLFPGYKYPITQVNDTKLVINTYLIGTFNVDLNIQLT